MINEEVWADVPGFDGMYQVSTQGRVRSFNTRGSTQQWTKKETPYMKKLTSRIRSNGKINGLYTGLTERDGRNFPFPVHRIVLEAFVGPRPEGFQACHHDGDPTNNNIINLRWDTPKANGEDTRRHNRKREMTDGYWRAIDTRQRTAIRQYLYARMIDECISNPDVIRRRIVEKYGFHESVLSRLLKSRRESLRAFDTPDAALTVPAPMEVG